MTEELIKDPSALLSLSVAHFEKWKTNKEPAELLVAGEAIVSYYRIVTNRFVTSMDPYATEFDNLKTRFARIDRIAGMPPSEIDLKFLSDNTYRLRNKLGHVDGWYPDSKVIDRLIHEAEAFTKWLSGKMQEAPPHFSNVEEARGQIDHSLWHLDTWLGVVSPYYPKEQVARIRVDINKLRSLDLDGLPLRGLELYNELVLEKSRSVERLADRMYTVCPRCGGEMRERNWTDSGGGTEDDPEPTWATQHWAIECATCRLQVEHEAVDI